MSTSERIKDTLRTELLRQLGSAAVDCVDTIGIDADTSEYVRYGVTIDLDKLVAALKPEFEQCFWGGGPWPDFFELFWGNGG